MFDYFTRIASLVLAFGFFISCSTLQSTNQEKQTARELSEKQIEQRLDSLSKQINSDHQEPDLFYEKGSLLTKLAQKQEEPEARTEIYVNANQSLTQAANLYAPGEQTEKVEELLNVTWSNEHNQGVQILQNDTTKEKSDYARAAAHFKNATVIIPDSTISYKMGARAYYQSQQPQKAIEILNKARKNVNSLPVPLLEQLAFLYLENDQQQKAVEIYEEAEAFSDQNLNLLHGLANAYINAGEHQKATELLDQLIGIEPKNVIYAQSLATELYFLASEQLQSMTSSLQKGEQIDRTSFEDADSLLNRAENQFKRIIDQKPSDYELKLNFANFYQNAASKYQRLLPLVEGSEKDKLHEKINRYISNAIPLLEQVAEKNPDESNVWQKLYQAYSYLGMEEKARNVKSNNL